MSMSTDTTTLRHGVGSGPRRPAVIFALAAMTGLGIMLAGCSKGRSSSGQAAASTASSTTGSGSTTGAGSGTTTGAGSGTTTGAGSGTTTGAGSGSTGSGTSGGGSTTGTPVVDFDGPVINVTSPQRGEFVSGSSVTVAGTVTDASGVAVLEINRLTVAVDPATGAFSLALPVEFGVNTLSLRASDTRGNPSDLALSILGGDFRPETEVVAEAAAARINEVTFDAFEPIIANQLTGARLSANVMRRNPLTRQQVTVFGLTIASAEVNITGVSLGNAVVDIDPTSQGLAMNVSIPNVNVGMEAHSFGGIPYRVSGSVTADSMDVRCVCQVTVTGNGQYDVTMPTVDLSFVNFNFDIHGIPSIIENLVRNTVRTRLEDEVESWIQNDIPGEIQRMLTSLTTTQTFTVNGSTLTTQWVPSDISFDDDGATVVVDADVTAAAGPNAFAAPGSLRTTSQLPAISTIPGFRVAFSDDILNRSTYALWRAGLMDVTIPSSAIPGTGIPIDSTALMFVFPQLAGRLPAGQPLEFTFTPLLPPIAKVTGQPDLMELQVGDLLIDILVDDGQGGRIQVLQVAVQITAGATPVLNGQTVRLAVNGRPTVIADVVAEPIADVDDVLLESLIQFVIPPAIQIGATMWSGAAIPTGLAQGLQVINLRAFQDGSSGDFITLEGDIR